MFERVIVQGDISLNNDSLKQNNQTESLIHNKNIIVQLLSDNLETKLNESAAILEIVSTLPQMRALPNSSLIDPSSQGIPKDADASKRQVATDILSIDDDFGRIFYIMPNGDMYFEEPYSFQQNLTRNNFAYRDYYKGAIPTGDTNLGNVVIFASSGLPQVNMAIPLYSANDNGNDHTNKNLIGLLAGDQNISAFSDLLRSLPLSENETALYIDLNYIKCQLLIHLPKLRPTSGITK